MPRSRPTHPAEAWCPDCAAVVPATVPRYSAGKRLVYGRHVTTSGTRCPRSRTPVNAEDARPAHLPSLAHPD